MNYVGGYGPSGAKLAIVGESPGRHEELQGRPFVGPTGKIVTDCLRAAGSNIDECYLTNVVKVRPPNNDIKLLHVLNHKIEDFLPQLHEELSALQPNCILALGSTALEALTGFKGIESYRGSILQATKLSTKVVASIHPASLLHGESDGGKLHSWKDLTYVRWDFQRAVNQSAFSGIQRPHRNLIVCKSNLDLYRFLNRYSGHNKVSIDIETYHTIPICIALAFNSSEAISVPLFPMKGNEMTRTDIIQCWRDLSEILANPNVLKIGQNFKFDELLLNTCYNSTTNFGLVINGFFFDTLLAFRTLYPELPGSLEFQTSVLTEEPYYKEEGKGYNPSKDKLDRLLLYNAKDAVVTYECYERELEELEFRGLTDFFFTKVMPLHSFYSRLEKRGIKRDINAAKNLSIKYSGMLEEKACELNRCLEPYDIKDVNCASPKQVANLLYGVLKLPIRQGTAEKVLDALVRNAVKKPEHKKIIELILEIRKLRKTIGTYINAKAHPDGRIRTGYRIMLETGRTSTSVLEPPVTTEKLGLAFQTITKHGDTGADLRSLFIPDPGYVFIEPDLSQAEARVVALLARDDKLLKMFEFGVDIHLVTYGWMENLVPDYFLEEFFKETDPIMARARAVSINEKLRAVMTEEQRQIGKKSRHAGHYDMGKREAADQLGISEFLANRFLLKFHNKNENIRGVFHAEIIEHLKNDPQRILRNPFGRERQMLNRWGDELFKEAYAQIPQSTVSDHLKFAAIRIEKRCPELQILQESHDSFLAQIEPLWLDKACRVIREELETPIDFSQCSLPRGTLVIPCDISIGEKNWLEMRKLKI